jgi:hypothetical protein
MVGSVFGGAEPYHDHTLAEGLGLMGQTRQRAAG